MQEPVHVFIIGSKGIPARYGGFESFVEHLVAGQKDRTIHYLVACLQADAAAMPEDYEHKEKCVHIAVPELGPAKAVLYDLKAFKQFLSYAKSKNISQPIFYSLTCRIGPFLWYFKRRLKKMGGTLLINPDGHEWKRSKWSWWVKRYWKLSEKLTVRAADKIVCDSQKIEEYIQRQYRNIRPATLFIPYGAPIVTELSVEVQKRVNDWLCEKGLVKDDYFLVVGRFVPENNLLTIIQEYQRSQCSQKLVLVTNVAQNNYLRQLEELTHFSTDERVCLAGPVYDEGLLQGIRKSAFAYLHGHEVGGTNPSLLEALGSTRLNLLLDVGFNREVGQESCFYWNKESGNLAELLQQTVQLTPMQIEKKGCQAKERIVSCYNWDRIIEQYEDLFKSL